MPHTKSKYSERPFVDAPSCTSAKFADVEACSNFSAFGSECTEMRQADGQICTQAHLKSDRCAPSGVHCSQ